VPVQVTSSASDGITLDVQDIRRTIVVFHLDDGKQMNGGSQWLNGNIELNASISSRTTGLLPEQAWDGRDQPQVHMYCGRPTGSAMPLMWAHAEYIKLLRSVRDGKVSDLTTEVAKRYLRAPADRQLFEVWKFTRQARSVKRGYVLRIQAQASFRLHWSNDEWRTAKDTSSSSTTLGVAFVDIPIVEAQQAPIRFTFFWTAGNHWEGRDFMVSIA
jgi:glucoamylase